MIHASTAKLVTGDSTAVNIELMLVLGYIHYTTVTVELHDHL